MDPGAQEMLQIILEKLGGLESRIAHQDEILRSFQTSANSSMAELQDVIAFAREKRAHISEQAMKQRLFMDALNLVAKNGFLSEVREGIISHQIHFFGKSRATLQTSLSEHLLQR